MRTSLKSLAVLGVMLLGACVSSSPAASTPGASEIPSASSSASASEPRRDLAGRVVFIRPHDNNFSLDEGAVFTANADGTNERELGSLGQGCCLFVTRDGDRVLVSALAPDGRVTTVHVNFDGSDRFLVPLPGGTLNLGPGPFSPDGTQVAFEGFDDAHPEVRGIYIGSADGTNLVQITDENDIPADWSPDGTQVLVLRNPENDDSQEQGHLFVVNVDGSGEQQLTPEMTVPCCWGYHWSPDGSRILFANQDGILWLVDPDGSDLVQLFVDETVSHVRRSAITPNWSPDGSQIIFALSPTPSNFDPTPNGLYVIDADGSDLTLAIGDNTFKREPYWVP